MSWTVFFGAADADEVAQSRREHGATVGVGPMDFGKGRVAWAADPDGAVFDVWELPAGSPGNSRRGWSVPAGAVKGRLQSRAYTRE